MNPVVFLVHATLLPLHEDMIWSEETQIGLIDSVFRNFYIPPIIFGQSVFYCLYPNLHPRGSHFNHG